MRRAKDPHSLLVSQSGVYRSARVSAAGAAGFFRLQGWQTAHINASFIESKQEFLQAAARALRLPTWFGNNWDAFEESLRDLPAAPGYLICIEEPAVFARSRPREWATALSILRDAARFWQEQGTPFYVLLSRTRGSAPDLPLIGKLTR